MSSSAHMSSSKKRKEPEDAEVRPSQPGRALSLSGASLPSSAEVDRTMPGGEISVPVRTVDVSYALATAALPALSAQALQRNLAHSLDRTTKDVVEVVEPLCGDLRAARDAAAAQGAAVTNLFTTETELALRRVLLKLCETVSEDEARQVTDCLDLALYLREEGYLHPNAPMTAIEEIFETVTIQDASTIFTYLERRKDILTKNMDPKRGIGIILLRVCNELKKRLSRTKDAEFAGRISYLLAEVYPLSERSAINLRCEFNVDNVTLYEDSADPDDVYARFWGLQKYCSNPPSLLKDDEEFENFKKGLDVTLHEFRRFAQRDLELTGFYSDDAEIHAGHPSSSSGPSLSSRRHQKLSVDDVIMEADAKEARARLTGAVKKDAFFPKYLTARNITNQEMADISFRRRVLLQLYFILDYLLTCTQQRRELVSKLASLNKFTLPPKDISPEQEAWAREASVSIEKELLATPGGRAYMDTVAALMSSERRWLEWKTSSCPIFELPELDLDSQGASLDTNWQRATASRRPFRFACGTRSLTEVFTRPFATDELLRNRHFSMPSFESLLDELIGEDLLPLPPYPPRVVKDVNAVTLNSWRGWKNSLLKKAEERRRKAAEAETLAKKLAEERAAAADMKAKAAGAEIKKEEQAPDSAEAEGNKKTADGPVPVDANSGDARAKKQCDAGIEAPEKEALAVVSSGSSQLEIEVDEQGAIEAPFTTEAQSAPQDSGRSLSVLKPAEAAPLAAGSVGSTTPAGSPVLPLEKPVPPSVTDVRKESPAAPASQSLGDAAAPGTAKVAAPTTPGTSATAAESPPAAASTPPPRALSNEDGTLTPVSLTGITNAAPPVPSARTGDAPETVAPASWRSQPQTQLKKSPPDTSTPEGEYENRMNEIARLESEHPGEIAPELARRRLITEVPITPEEVEEFDSKMWKVLRLASQSLLGVNKTGRHDDLAVYLDKDAITRLRERKRAKSRGGASPAPPPSRRQWIV